MFLTLNHQQLDIYKTTRQFTNEYYQLTKALAAEERFGMISQIRRAALSVHLNVAEGASIKSVAERKRFYEIARGSLIEVDAALDIAADLHYLEALNTEQLGLLVVKTFKILSGLIAH
jgi:four helix bundle protein